MIDKINKIFNSNVYKYTSLCVMYVYVVTFIPLIEVSKLFYVAFLILSLPILIVHRDKIFKDPMVLLLGVVLIIQVLSWMNSVNYYPDFANSAPKLDRLSKLFVFVFMAYWLKGNIVSIYVLLCCYLMGIVISFFNYPDFYNEIVNAFQGVRVSFGMKNPQFTSMLGAMGILISMFIYFHVNKYIVFNNKKILYFANILLGFGVILFVYLLIVSQSRQAWLALSISALFSPIIIKMIYKNVNTKSIVIFYSLISSILVLFSQVELINTRAKAEPNTYAAIMDGNFDNIPMTSVGIRVNSWLEALNWIKKHPILGVDESAISEVISQSPKFISANLTGFGHLHNYHIETVVAYGFVGLIALYFMYYWLVRSTIKASKLTSEAKPFILLSTIFLLFWVIVNCFETISGRRYGVLTHNIIFACCYTFYLTQSLYKINSKE